MKMPIVMRIVSIILTIAGVGLVIGSTVVAKNTLGFLKTSIKTEGVVIKLERSDGGDMASPVVEFVTNNGKKQVFTASVSSNPPSHRVDEKVVVLYNEKSPQEVKIEGFFFVWFLPFVLLILGIPNLGIGLGINIFYKKRNQFIERVKQSGRILETKYVGVKENMAIAVNRRHPFRIFTEYKENNQVYIFHSKNFWTNPEKHIQREKITVYAEPSNLKKYYMDVSFLGDLK